MHGEMERRNPNFRRENDIDRVCDCAIRLVHLGAKCQVNLHCRRIKLNMPPPLLLKSVSSSRPLPFCYILRIGKCDAN
jgi:hypothetical protein